MTKNLSNFTSSNKTKKKTVVKNESAENVDKLIENADKIMDDLSMEDFQKVLEQMTDYSLPESKKSPLVQKLNQQYAKEDNCLEAAMFESNAKVNQTCESVNNRNDLETVKCDQFEGELNHLQKLETFCETFDSSCNSVNASLTNSLLNNWNTKRCRLNNSIQSSTESSFYSSSPLTTPHSSDSSQAFIHNHQLPDNSSKCCDNLNCESCKQRSKLLFSVSNNVPKIEMKDYGKRAQIVEYTSALSLNKNHSADTNQLKIDFVNTQFAENCLNELNDTNRNYSSDCLNRYHNLDDKQSHKTLSSSTSDGHISNSYFDSDKSSNYHLNSNYLKKGSTSSSIQTNGKSEINNYLIQKKRKKPEKAKLTQDCEGYVGWNKDIQFLTNYITGNSETSESMRDTAINSSKEMNGRKRDKKELNDLNVARKRNGKEINNEATNVTSKTSTTEHNDLANDKNNNNLPSATNNNIIPTNHQSSSIRKESTDLSIRVISSSAVASNDHNMNNQSGNKTTSRQQQVEKRNDKVTNNKSTSSRKSSTSLENSNNSRQSNDDQSSAAVAIKIVSNGLSASDFDSIDCTQSDPEDKESGFKIVKYKQLSRKKQKGKNAISDSSKTNKKDQPAKTSSNPATARGYESESDYCAVEGRKKGGLERDNQSEVKQLLEYKDALSKVPGLTNNQSAKSKRSKRTDDKHDDQMNYSLVQEPFINSAPSMINNTVSQSKISYAAITKMHYSNSTTNGVQNSINLNNSNVNNNNVNNGNSMSAQTITNQEHTAFNSKKDNKKKNSTNNLDNKPSKANKSINLNDSRTEVYKTESSNKSKDDKKPQELTNSKQAKKQTNKLNKNESNEAMKEEKFNTAEMSYDSSRTISLDTTETPSVMSSKSSSFNSTNQPPVIMFDNKNIDENTTFTFGFFDENAQFQINVVEEQSEQFSLINVNSVNFISKESNVNQQQQKQHIQPETNSDDTVKNEANNETKTDEMKSEIITTGTPVSISDILNSPINSTNILNSSITLNSNTPIHEGTYIMDYDGGDNLTKKVQDKSNDEQISCRPVNEITSYNLNKFKEKIPSPIDHNPYLAQSNYRYPKPTKPEFTCNVAYIQAVNYVRRAWDATNNSNPTHLKYDGPINWKQIESNLSGKSMNLITNIQACN